MHGIPDRAPPWAHASSDGVRRAAAVNAVSSRTWPMLPRGADAAITPANAPSTRAALPESGRLAAGVAGGRCRADAALVGLEGRDENAMVRIDMSESMKQHAVSRLVAVREPETIPAGVRGTHE
jgi:hypothetical protein